MSFFVVVAEHGIVSGGAERIQRHVHGHYCSRQRG